MGRPRVQKALEEAKEYYQGLISDTSLDNARYVYETHLLILKDIAERVESGIAERKLNVEHILEGVVNAHLKIVEEVEDPYMKERGADVKNAGRIILEKLSGTPCRKKIEGEEVIVVAEEILATDMGEIMRAKAKPFSGLVSP